MNYGSYSANMVPVTSGRLNVRRCGIVIRPSCEICSMRPFARN